MILKPDHAKADRLDMPTLSRFLLSLIALAVIAYVVVFALAHVVTPTQREITVRVPTDRLQRE